jgi:hypothetical protein
MKKTTTCGICNATGPLDFDAWPVQCPCCGAIATWLNVNTGEVFNWEKEETHHDNCRRLQDAMDDAFDNQYFNEW